MTTSVYRSLLHELRQLNSCGTIKKNSLIFTYLNSQFNKYRTTDETLCKAKEEMQFVANTYLCYLSSVRRQNEINKEFSGRGERSIQEAANLVGFKLPHDPK